MLPALVCLLTLFRQCLKSLWTGPGSAALESGRQAKTLGQPPIAWKYRVLHITPRMLAYTAVQVRPLTSQRPLILLILALQCTGPIRAQ